MTESITCPQCGRTSHHPEDVKQRYCGACHEFHDMMSFKTKLRVELVAAAEREAKR